MKSWIVDVDGVQHKIEYKRKIRMKLIVDGEEHKLKSSNGFIRVVDYAINLGSTVCNLVIIGNKVDLAVNGTYLDSGKQYEPVNNLPSYIWALVGVSSLGGFLAVGILGMAIGIVMSGLYIKFAFEKKKGAVIGSFVGCTVLQLLLIFAVIMMRPF